jgi:hypothetical protein
MLAAVAAPGQHFPNGLNILQAVDDTDENSASAMQHVDVS